MTSGFHCLVDSNYNLQSSSLVYGKKDGDFVQAVSLTDSLMKIGKYLKIKQHPIKGRIMGDISNSDVYISNNLVVYKIDPPEMLANTQNRESVTVFNSDNNILTSNDEGLYIIRNGSSIFPLDIEVVSQRSKITRRQRFRPEFLKNYPKKLNPDTMQDNQTNKQLDQNDFELTEANKVLTSRCLQDLVNGLDSMEFLPMDSPGLARVFHQFGVNMRYLGVVTENTRLPHIREFLIAEIIARSTRKLLDKEIVYMTYKIGERNEHASFKGVHQSEIEYKKIAYINDFNQDLKGMVLKILNLTLTKSDQSYKYWEFMVKPQVFSDYRYTFPKNWSFDDLPGGCLIHACMYHFNIHLRDRIYEIGADKDAFLLDDIIDFNNRTICLGFNGHRVRNLISHYEEHKATKEFRSAVRLLQIKLAVEEHLMCQQVYLDTLAELAEVYLLMGEYNKAIETCSQTMKRLNTHSPTYIPITLV